MPGAAGQLKALWKQIIGGTAPSGAASASGDISQMIKQLIQILEDTAYSNSVTEDIDGTVLERLEYCANRLPAPVVGIVKPSDETRSNTTLSDDNDFTFSLAANEKAIIEMQLFGLFTSAQGIHFRFNGSTNDWMSAHFASAYDDAYEMSNEISWSPSSGNYIGIHIRAGVTAGGSPVTVAFQWARNAGSGTITLRAGSWMKYEVIT